MGRLRIILAAGTLAIVLGGCGDTATFECPLPQKGASEVLPESPEKIKELSGLLASGDMGNRIHLIIADLRRKYPKADMAAIVNYLVTAYCPVVDAEEIGDEAKTEKVNAFSSEVLKIIASQSPSP